MDMPPHETEAFYELANSIGLTFRQAERMRDYARSRDEMWAKRVEEAERDAARYCWLRNNQMARDLLTTYSDEWEGQVLPGTERMIVLQPADFDAQIDAAIREDKSTVG